MPNIFAEGQNDSDIAAEGVSQIPRNSHGRVEDDETQHMLKIFLIKRVAIGAQLEDHRVIPTSTLKRVVKIFAPHKVTQ